MPSGLAARGCLACGSWSTLPGSVRVGHHPCGGCREIDLVHTGVRPEAHAVAYPHRVREKLARGNNTRQTYIPCTHTNYYTSNHTITARYYTDCSRPGYTYLSRVSYSYSSSSSHVTTRSSIVIPLWRYSHISTVHSVNVRPQIVQKHLRSCTVTSVVIRSLVQQRSRKSTQCAIASLTRHNCS